MPRYYCDECEREFELEDGDEPTCPSDGSELWQLPKRLGLSPGDVIGGRYTLDEPLGRGAMGTVFRAEHQASGEPVAVKLIRNHNEDETAVKRFFREAKASTRIDHPAVVEVYDYGQTDGEIPYMVMEILTGDSLRDILQRDGSVEPRRAAHLAAEVASGLAATHTLEILHRDLKPSNAVVERDDEGVERAKILDFGLAKAVEGGDEDLRTVTTTGTLVGTPAYMSPEQFRSNDLVPETDLYALGCLLYRMVTGRLPYRGDNVYALMQQHVTQDPAPFEEVIPGRTIPDGLEELCRELMAKEIEDRPGDAAEVAERLYDLADRAAPVDVPREPGDVTVEVDSEEIVTGATIQSHGAPRTIRQQMTRPDLVGRSDTRRFLENVLEQTTEEGESALVALEGPGGVGKSTLVEWFRGRTHDRADCVAVGYHDEGHLGAFGAVREAIESLLDVEGAPGGEIEERLEELAATGEGDGAGLTAGERERLREFLRPESGGEGRRELDEDDRAALYEAVIRGFRAVAASGSTAVLLDDLRDDRPFDDEFVERLGRHLADCDEPLLVLMATRTDAAREDDLEVAEGGIETMERAVSSLARMLRDRFYRVEVDPLDEEDVERLLERALPGIAPDASSRIADYSGGNPLHALQLVRHLVSEGTLERRGREWVLAGEITLPEDLDAVIEARLETLRDREEERALLVRAALVGERVPLELLEEVLERGGDFELLDELDLLIDRLIDDGWLRDASSWEAEEVVFEHGFVRDALVDRYGSRRAARKIHRVVGEAKEAYHADALEPVASEIADHFVACREPGRALSHLQTAARAAERRYAVDEAIELWERALEVGTGRRAPDWDVDAARRSLVRLLIHAGRYDEAERALDELGDAPETLELRGDLADARAEYEEAIEYYEESVETFEEMDRARSAASVRIPLAVARTKCSQHERANAVVRSALEYARSSADRELRARSLNQLAMIAQIRGELDEALEFLEREEKVWRDLDDNVALGRCLYTLGSLYWRRSEFEEALGAYGEAIPLLERAGHRRGLVHCLRMAGSTAERLGRLDEALAYCERALDIAERLDDRRSMVGVALCFADVYKSRGEYSDSRNWAERALRLARELEDPRKRRMSLLTLGEIALEDDEPEDATSHVCAAIEVRNFDGATDDLAYAHRLLGNANSKLDRIGTAIEHYEAALEMYRKIGNSSAAQDVKCELRELDSND